MNTIKLNGANPEKIAELIGGTLIMHNMTHDTAMIAGGDLAKLEGLGCELKESNN